MVRRFRFVALVAFLLTTSLGVFMPTRAVAAPNLGRTSLPPQRPVKYSAQALPSPVFPYVDTFKLHSRPGSQRVIYLDFDGETVSGTQWNTEYTGGDPFNAPAYDFDGNTSSFSNGELAVIQSAWQRVAEDFAPFAVDVTTEDPGLAAIDRATSSDLVFGTRALITNTDVIFGDCGCAGVGYIGVFDAPAPYHQRYQPALVFGKALGEWDKDLGDAISHEVGHNLGLDHDGQGSVDYYLGHGPWAPIMGAGYYHPITQWSKGEYANATNAEDDFAVMQQFGLPLRSDDHSGTTAAATPLVATAAGLIGTAADVDMFSFESLGGPATVTATPATRGPNLDIKLELLDSAGNVVAASNPPAAEVDFDSATGLGASVSAPTSVGTHYVRVQGVGSGDPLDDGYSDYGSVGVYRLTSELPTPRTVSVSDVVVSEGTDSVVNASFTLSLNAPSPNPVTVSLATTNGTALAGADYVARTDTVTIPAGATSQSFSVSVSSDSTPEPHERFSLVASNAVGGLLGDAVGVATIVNDDGVGIWVNKIGKLEGGAGKYTTFTFTVSLTIAPVTTIGVTATTASGSASGGGVDYFGKQQLFTFSPGQKTKTFTVTVRGDSVAEAHELFYVTLSNPTGTGARVIGNGIGQIRNDD